MAKSVFPIFYGAKRENHLSCSSSESIHPQHARVRNSKANCTMWPIFNLSKILIYSFNAEDGAPMPETR